MHAFQRIAHRAVALLGGIERAARSFGAGFRVIRYLLHGDGQFFHRRRGVGDFLILLGRARGHLVGGHENLVCTGGHVDGALAYALEHGGEVVEHVVDRIHHVAQRIVGHLAAQRQVAARHLVDHAQ